MLVETILTAFDGSPEGEEQLQSAIDVAHWFEAHLSVAAVAYLPDFRCTTEYTPDFNALRQRAEAEASARGRLALARLAQQGVRGEAIALVTTRADLDRRFNLLAQEADVTVQAKSVRPPAASMDPCMSVARGL